RMPAMGSLALGGRVEAAVGVESRVLRRLETTLEPTPGDVRIVQQVADVAARHAQRSGGHYRPARIGTAVIEVRIEVADIRNCRRAGLVSRREGIAACSAA